MDTNMKKALARAGGLLSVGQVAAATNSSESTVRRWARENDVPRVGASFAFAEADVEAYVAELDASDDEDYDDEDMGDDEEDAEDADASDDDDLDDE
jgi:excisionase family DNA binding protein